MMLKEIVQMFSKSLVTVEHQSKYLSSRFRILLKNIVFFLQNARRQPRACRI